jgi:small subunit ribosomal protein S14
VAKKSLVIRAQRAPKFRVRQTSRCRLCGRSGAYMRRFGLCRHCFRALAHRGEIPGVTKASW